MTSWAFNRDYKDLRQVAEFYPAYTAIFEELQSAGQYPYNDLFRGRIPGIAGPAEDTAIYLLQCTRHLAEHTAALDRLRAAGWRDLDPAEPGDLPARFAGIADHSFEMGGTGLRRYDNARLARYGSSSLMVLPGRQRTRGFLVCGRLLVLGGTVSETGRTPC